MIHLTDAAQDQIIKLCRETRVLGIRLEVISGGCSGYKYMFGLVEDTFEDESKDRIVGAAGAALFVDYTSAIKIDGGTIDYIKDLMSEQFVVNIPNSQQCGCGKSFS